MFEYMNGFEGFSGSEPSPFAMASDRDFTYARGVVGSGCPSGCSPCYNGVGCCQDGFARNSLCKWCKKN